MANLKHVMEFVVPSNKLVGANCDQGSCSHTGSNSSACYGVKLSVKKSK